MPLVIPEDHVRWRLENFWGYGNFNAPVWFVGMEEGLSNGGECYLPARFAATNGKALVDIRRDMFNVKDHMIWFTRREGRSPYRIQPTILFPIALYLYLSLGREPNKYEIRVFQGEQWGGEAACAIDLMPLPSNSTRESAWLYEKYASLGLATRSQYLETYQQNRVRKLREVVRHYKPALVIFYSVTYREHWQDVADARFRELMPQMHFVSSDDTQFCVIPLRALSYTRVYEFAERILREQSDEMPTTAHLAAVPATRSGGKRMLPRLEYTGRYVFANDDKLRERAARTNDPRHVFYRAMLTHSTYDDYEAEMGARVVMIPTRRGQRPVTGHAEIRYARDDRGWIRDASN